MYADQVNNPHQQEIILKLSGASHLRYKDLCPLEMPSNQFAYHIKKLRGDGYVVQDPKTKEYTLGPKGLRLADSLSYKTDYIRQQPKDVIILHITSSDGGRVLFAARLKQPHIGKTILPSGKLHFGETLEHSAIRNLRELLPDSNVGPLHRGNFRLIYKSGRITVSHIMASVFTAKLNSEDEETLAPPSSSQTSRPFWLSLSEVSELKDEIGGLPQILDALKGADFFNLELEVIV